MAKAAQNTGKPAGDAAPPQSPEDVAKNGEIVGEGDSTALAVIPEHVKKMIVPGGRLEGFSLEPRIPSFRLIRSHQDIVAKTIKENLGAAKVSAFDLDRIKIPAGGSTVWEVPSLKGSEATKEVVGVVVFFDDPRAYWSIPYEQSGGGTPPDCSSPDGYEGVGKPGGSCNNCEFSAFKSAMRIDRKSGQQVEGRGQACRQIRRVFLLREKSLMPVLINCPPTSLKAIRSYFLRLADEAVPYYGCLTKFTLLSDKNADGTPYSKVVPEFIDRLAAQEVVKIEEFANSMKAAFGSITTLDRSAYEPAGA